MKRFRFLTFALVVLSVAAVASPSYALCVKCVSNECWSFTTATAARCESYGTSCITAGKCAQPGSGGDDECFERCWYEQMLASPNELATPLALEYRLAEVTIQRSNANAASVVDMNAMNAIGRAN